MSILSEIKASGSALLNLVGYFSQLQQASFNGVPFFTRSNSTQVGRRLSEHVYPFRDLPWMEDIGRKGRKYYIVGFLVGDDVIAQRNAMQAALENSGPGVLVHPTYGRLTVSATDQCTFEEDMSHGRVIEMRLVFQESGVKVYPASNVSTGNAVLTSAVNAKQATSDDFVDQVSAAFDAGAEAAGQALTTASQWIDKVTALSIDATSIFHVASIIVGPFGRFFGGSTGSGSGSITGNYIPPSQVEVIVAGLISQSSTNLATINEAADETLLSVSGDIPLDMASSVQSLAASLLSSIANPADAIRIFSDLNNFVPIPITAISAIASDQTIIQTSMADLLRRTAAIALAQASSTYQPTSQQDAESLRSQVVTILDNEILIAGNEGLDETFYALTDLRNAVAQDLTTRGAALPSLQTFMTNLPLPALTLAYQYYQDITRTDQLVYSANAVHPAFMPVSFQALSS